MINKKCMYLGYTIDAGEDWRQKEKVEAENEVVR